MSAEPIGRDYAREMRAMIDAETAGASYAAPIVAARIVEKLRATDPDLLAGWLDASAVNFVRDAISARDRSARTHARAVASRGAFGDAASGQGDVAALGCFLQIRYVVDDHGSRKPLAEMRSTELIYVAEDYEVSAKEARFEAAWLRAIAKQIGKSTVGEVFEEEQLAEMRTNFGRAA